MAQQPSTWIVLADAGRARILQFVAGGTTRRIFEEDDLSRRFAVTDAVNETAARGGVQRLILVANQRTLGELRTALSDAARARVVAECEQDLTRFSDELVLRALGDTCPAAARELTRGHDDAGGV